METREITKEDRKIIIDEKLQSLYANITELMETIGANGNWMNPYIHIRGSALKLLLDFKAYYHEVNLFFPEDESRIKFCVPLLSQQEGNELKKIIRATGSNALLKKVNDMEMIFDAIPDHVKEYGDVWTRGEYLELLGLNNAK